VTAAYLRRGTRQEEDESVFISMTDIMISLLFIVIILMAFFAMQTRTTEPTIARSVYDFDISKRDMTIGVLNQDIKEYKATITELSTKIRDRENTIILLKQKVDKLLKQIAALASKVDALSEERKHLKAQILTQETTIFELGTKILELEKIIILLKQKVDAFKKQIEALTSEVDALSEERKHLKAQILILRNAQQKALDKFLAGIADSKKKIMELIADNIRETTKIRVRIDHQQGIIRFDSSDFFDSAQWRDSPEARKIMNAIASAVADTLPCYTTGPHSNFSTSCNPHFAIIDAIQIEGHTDDQRTTYSMRLEYINDNLELSVRRATTTYRTMVSHRSELETFRNNEVPAQPVLSVSGYGDTRPIADNDTESGRADNRRIDLRFIMMTPQSQDEVRRFKSRLLNNLDSPGGEP